jgi:hypothetical protein
MCGRVELRIDRLEFKRVAHVYQRLFVAVFVGVLIAVRYNGLTPVKCRMI